MTSPGTILKSGTRVKTHPKLEETTGMLIDSHHLSRRKPDVLGTIVGVVPGHGGDVYWVTHEGSEVPAAYSYSEFEVEGGA